MPTVYRSFEEAENALRQAFKSEPNNLNTRCSEMSLDTGFGKIKTSELISDDDRLWGMNPERYWSIKGL